MKDFGRWFLKTLLVGTIWVFVLSVPVRGELLFDHAHDFLVRNSLVDLAQRELGGAWDKFKVAARAALSDEQEGEELSQAL